MKEMIEPELLTALEQGPQTGKWKVYEEYKDSAVEWLGEIPKQWKAIKIKRLFLVKRGASPRPIDDPTYFDDNGEYAWVRISDVTASNKYLHTTEQSLSLLGQSKSVKLEPGALFLSIAGSVGKPIITSIKCCIHDGFVYFVGLKENPEYLFYIFSCGEVYKGLGKMGTQLNLNTDTIGDIKLPIPSLHEQQIIITFLNHETAKLNELITRKERMITLLQERRTAVINQAVTRGLNLDVPMKNSGVDWLGEIPAHWETRKIKYVAKFFGGGTPSKANIGFWSGNIPWVSPKDMKSEIILDTEDHISIEAVGNSTTNFIQAGAVLIVVRSGILKHTIPTAINNVPVTINQDIKAILPNNLLLPQYLASLIHSHQEIFLMEWRKSGATVESIEYDLLINTSVPIPPIEEQKEIVTSIQQKTVPIDKLISVIQEGIKKLKEYSTALISAAVTGKIDVRGEVANVQAEETAM